MTKENILMARTSPAYAELYINGNANSNSVPAGSGYTKPTVSGFTQGNVKNCAVSLTNGEITIGKNGKYFVSCAFSSRLGTNDVIWDTAVFINGEEASDLHMRRRFSTSGYTFNVAMSGIADLSAGDVLDIRVKHNNASAVAITTEYANISLYRFA